MAEEGIPEQARVALRHTEESDYRHSKELGIASEMGTKGEGAGRWKEGTQGLFRKLKYFLVLSDSITL